jgi:cytochrome c oxidase assembly protein subunit 15
MSARGSDVLTLGFGTTVSMWTVGYVGRLPSVQWPSPVLLALMLVCLLGGGFVAARLTGRGASAGLRAGLLASFLNLLILGSLLTGGGSTIMPSMLLWLPGSLAAGALLGSLGGLLGGHGNPAYIGSTLYGDQGMTGRSWDSAFSLSAISATVLLIVAGGVVTGQQAGLAVVDWPNSFGSNMFLYPLSRMTGGIYFEHSHRLIGSLVGLTTLLLTVQLWRAEDRSWVKRLALAALIIVIIQGILGGLRVTGHFTMSQDTDITQPSILLAIVHGVLAQVFLSILVGLFCVTTPLWRNAKIHTHPGAGIDHTLSRILVIMVIIQLILGAILRHIDDGLLYHITWAVFVAMLALFAGLRAKGEHPNVPMVPGLGGNLTMFVGFQLVLGVMALWGTSLTETHSEPHLVDVVFTTLHQTTGALVLAISVMLMLWTRRLLTSGLER